MSKKKINPLIFRLGVLNQWDSKFIEAKNKDSSIYLLNYLELKTILKQFLKKYNLILTSFKFFANKNSLNLFICYNTNFNAFFYKSILKFKALRLNKIIKNYVSTKNYRYYIKTIFLKAAFLKKVKNNNILNLQSRYNAYKEKVVFKQKKPFSFLRVMRTFTIKKRLHLIKFFYFFKNRCKNFNNFKNVNSFRNKIIQFVNKIFKNNQNMNISLIFKQLNNANLFNTITKPVKKNLISKVLNFKQFEKKAFFKSGINLFFILSKTFIKQHIVSLICKYLTTELSKIISLNDFNIFLKFIISSIKHFILDKTNGVQILIKGNLGKNSRAFFKQFNIGHNLSKTKINSTLKYSKGISFSKKGNLGVSVFVF